MDPSRVMPCASAGTHPENTAQCTSDGRALEMEKPTAAQISPAAEQEHKLEFHGDGLTLLRIILVNALLTVATLGVFYFWGKVRVRRYLYSQTSFAGDRFAYHGTGLQLFIGWLKALCVFAPLIGAGIFLRIQLGEAGEQLAKLLFYSALVVLIPILAVSTWRFRLARTSWRGIRFSFRGRVSSLMREWFRGVLATVFTLGIYSPGLRVILRRYIANNVYFGKEHFECDAEEGAVIGRSLLCGLLFLPTLGLSLIWLNAWRERYFWDHTVFKVENNVLKGARFQSSLSFGDLLLLYFSNALLLIFTLGIAYPWVLVRSRRLHLSRFKVFGELDLDAMQQSAQKPSAIGEELGGILDVGMLDFELGL